MVKQLIKSGATIVMCMAFIYSCSQSGSENTATRENHGLSIADMDTTVSPRQDFYEYADGGWIASHPIPPDRSSYGSFNELQDHNYEILRNILQEAAASNAKEGSIQQKVGDFYASGMDSTAINAAGITPVKSVLDQINQINGKASLLKTIADLRTEGMGTVYGFFVNQDDKDATKMTAYIGQGGLGLPDRDYYLKSSKRFATIRNEYLKHVASMFELMGDNAQDAQNEASVVMSIEKNMAVHSMTRVERRNPDNTYHKMTLTELDKLTPGISWKNQLGDLGISNVDYLIVRQPEFMKAVDKMFSDVSIRDWKTYLRWHVINDAAPYLSHPFEQEDFNFYGEILQGRKQMQPRWKRVLQTVNGGIGMALGQLYVQKAFPPEAKQKAMEMINDLKSAFRDRIHEITWMSEATKQKALQKLDAFMPKIGYPDKWIDYSTVHITRDNYFTNVMNADKFAFKRMINKLGKPVDRSEWYMTPPTVNAYYNPNMNEIVFPAGILQPPFFDPKADAALNYGGMGSVIGHEMSHAFDDEGSKFDAHGNLHNWWTTEDRDNFNKRAQQLINEYDGFRVLDSLHINGKLTLGENIADNGGVSIAYAALQKYYQKHGKPDKIQGFTPDQRFFLAWARIWRGKSTPQSIQNRLITDPHSPGKYRTIGVVENMNPFYKAFNVQPGDSMYVAPDKRANVWAEN